LKKNLLGTLKRVYCDFGMVGGTVWVAERVYSKWIRPILPNGEPIRYAGVIVGYRKLGDGLIPKDWRPRQSEDQLTYEDALVRGLQKFVKKGDRVVIVGGGLGVTAVIAARLVTESGGVTCYEGAEEGVKNVRATAQLNQVGAQLKIEHAVVGSSISVWGAVPDNGVVDPGSLPECDVLELDCEGAEVEILEKMIIKPGVVLVETHGFLGAPRKKVREKLEWLGYQVTELGVAESRVTTFCVANDIYVLAGLRKVDPSP